MKVSVCVCVCVCVLVCSSKATYQLSLDVPRSALVLGLLRCQLDIGQLNDHLQASLGKVLVQVDLLLGLGYMGSELARFRASDGLSLLPFVVSLIIFVTMLVFLVFWLRLRLGMLVILDFIVGDSLVLIPHEGQGGVPQRDGLLQDLLDDLVQLAMFVRMQVIYIRRNATFAIVSEMHVTGKPLEFAAVGSTNTPPVAVDSSSSFLFRRNCKYLALSDIIQKVLETNQFPMKNARPAVDDREQRRMDQVNHLVVRSRMVVFEPFRHILQGPNSIFQHLS